MTEEQFTPLAQRYMDTVFRVAYSYLRSLVTDDLKVILAGNDLTGGVNPGGSTTEGGGGGQTPGGSGEVEA